MVFFYTFMYTYNCKIKDHSQDKMIYSNNFFWGTCMSNSISNLKEKETVRWGLGKS